MLIRRIAASAIVLVVSLLAGCLERFEAITIKPDGGVLLRSEFRGTPADFEKTADALPEQGGAWAITERQENDKDGKPRTIRVAELSLTPGASLPDSYAASKDSRYLSALRFPTTFKTIHENGGTRFEFSRTYQHRDDARYSYLKKKLTESDEFKAMQGKDPSTLTPEQRTLLLRTLICLDADKHVRFVETGAQWYEADGTWPQHIGLTLRQAVLAYADHFDITKAEALFKQAETPERDAAMNAMADQFAEGINQAIKDSLIRLSIPDDQQKRFLNVLNAERTLRQATEDLADERWEIRLTMPGTLVAHNADRVEGTVLVWEFSADALMDRDQTIKATSRVESAK